MGTREAASGAVGLACLVAVVLIWTVGKKHTPRLVLALVITSSVGFLNTRLGGWIRAAFGWIDRMLGSVMGWLFGATLVGLIAFICVYIVVIDLKAHGRGGGGDFEGGGRRGGGGGFLRKFQGHNVGNRTLAAGGILPFASIGLPGYVGAAIYTVLAWLSSLIAWGLGALFGVH